MKRKKTETWRVKYLCRSKITRKLENLQLSFRCFFFLRMYESTLEKRGVEEINEGRVRWKCKGLADSTTTTTRRTSTAMTTPRMGVGARSFSASTKRKRKERRENIRRNVIQEGAVVGGRKGVDIERRQASWRTTPFSNQSASSHRPRY